MQTIAGKIRGFSETIHLSLIARSLITRRRLTSAVSTLATGIFLTSFGEAAFHAPADPPGPPPSLQHAGDFVRLLRSILDFKSKRTAEIVKAYCNKELKPPRLAQLEETGQIYDVDLAVCTMQALAKELDEAKRKEAEKGIADISGSETVKGLATVILRGCDCR